MNGIPILKNARNRGALCTKEHGDTIPGAQRVIPVFPGSFISSDDPIILTPLWQSRKWMNRALHGYEKVLSFSSIIGLRGGDEI